MFIDEVKLKVKAGNGGDGIVSWRREYKVEKGGPFGGNGGHGGSVIFKVDSGLSTLMDFRYQKHIKTKNGEKGRTKTQHGKNAEDTIVKVPQGSTVYDVKTGLIIADLVEVDQEAVIVKGGRGGRGNAAFATPRVVAPDFCELGEPGEEREIKIVLRVLADVGLVGFPSVGKSTLISSVSSARPKIASYHFTTLVPNLGFVSVPDGRSFVMADLPGLIEGASSGAGLGIQFLKHIERTRVIVHVVDMAGHEGRDPFVDYQKINHELASYKMNLLKRPQIIVANKMDLPNAEENLETFKSKLTEDIDIIPISAVTRQNLNEMLYKIADLLENASFFPIYEEDELEENKIYEMEEDKPKFEINLDSDGVYVVTGHIIERLFKMTNFSQHESVRRFSKMLRKYGVDHALREKGVKNGDIVRILSYEFEFID
ncbi:GTPase ObgE [Mycoplasmatota bacterium]|nr:GTPase ObgE [Mycoplasmatota bacterium]